jgi:hypothetical protein
MQQKGKVSGGFRGQAVALEAEILAQRLGRLPAVAEGRIGNHSVALELFGRVHLVE